MFEIDQRTAPMPWLRIVAAGEKPE